MKQSQGCGSGPGVAEASQEGRSPLKGAISQPGVPGRRTPSEEVSTPARTRLGSFPASHLQPGWEPWGQGGDAKLRAPPARGPSTYPGPQTPQRSCSRCGRWSRCRGTRHSGPRRHRSRSGSHSPRSGTHRREALVPATSPPGPSRQGLPGEGGEASGLQACPPVVPSDLRWAPPPLQAHFPSVKRGVRLCRKAT